MWARSLTLSTVHAFRLDFRAPKTHLVSMVILCSGCTRFSLSASHRWMVLVLYPLNLVPGLIWAPRGFYRRSSALYILYTEDLSRVLSVLQLLLTSMLTYSRGIELWQRRRRNFLSWESCWDTWDTFVRGCHPNSKRLRINPGWRVITAADIAWKPSADPLMI